MTPTPAPRILVTGAAGFIGFHLCRRLLDEGYRVYGLDNLNDYYDPRLKQDRLALLQGKDGFTFTKGDIADADTVSAIFHDARPSLVVHLAAQAGVRYSIDNPRAYIDSNITGFLNILESCRANPVQHLIFASSSSVYGGNTKTPFAEDDPVDHPVSLYAATKKSNELMAHTYAHLFGIPCTGLRFFTVYGPWGRPDMAAFKFVKAAFNGTPIDVYNGGDMKRDFTYIDDIVEGIVRLLPLPPASADGRAPHAVYNIGNNQPENLLDFINIIEKETGRTVQKNFLPMQMGDVKETYADLTRLAAVTGFKPTTALQDGIRAFVDWYRTYYKIGDVTAKAG